MIYKISDLVSLDEQAEFRSDVQLDAYDDPKLNLALLRSYLFTHVVPNSLPTESKVVSSIGLLHQIIESYNVPQLDGRFALIANYGHGKSHLALALANYFGKQVGSSEINIVLDKIKSSLSNEALFGHFHDFKKNRGSFLIIRVRGDVPQSLHTQFMAGLEKGLKEQPATATAQLPFWYMAAESALAGLQGEALQKANQFLAGHSLDVPALHKQVQARQEVYELCLQTVKAAVGIHPDFGKEVSLTEALHWAVTTFCGVDKPLGGVLVLFDEFSLYVQRYIQRGAVGELQDLLNGVDKHRDKVVFLAFAQHDPLTLADNLTLLGQSRESLKKELTRLTRKFTLYSSMESVINAYLQQKGRVWELFLGDNYVRGAISWATDITLLAFSKRYEKEMRWGPERFQEVVTKGCFPLHPITTALLCSVTFAGTDIGTPRTTLGFVQEHLEQLGEMPAFSADRKISWVLPIHLVDYFAQRLNQEWYATYENALGQGALIQRDEKEGSTGGLTEEQVALLKGLLLYYVAKLSLKAEYQRSFLGQCAGGIPTDKVSKQLQPLVDHNIIRYDSIQKVYSFWAANTDPNQLRKLINQKLDTQPFNLSALEELNRQLETLTFGKLSIALAWGNAEDWAAKESVVTPDLFTKEYLREKAHPFMLGKKGIEEGSRGYLFWLVAQTDAEQQWCHSQAAKILGEAFPEPHPLPIVVMLPTRPTPDLITTFQRLKILNSFTKEEKATVGQELYERELGQNKLNLVYALRELRGEAQNYADTLRQPASFLMPPPYRAHLSTAGSSIKKVLENLYLLAYPYAPPEFLTQYPTSKGSLKVATKTVATQMKSPSGLQNATKTSSMVRDLVEKILRGKWQLLTPDYRVQEPGHHKVRQVWNYLQQKVVAGQPEIALRNVLLPLFNPPYGYDYNTAVLIFFAWFSYFAHDLRLSEKGIVVKQDRLYELLEKEGKEFLVNTALISNIALFRRNRDEDQRYRESLIDRVKREIFTQEAAEKAIAELQEFLTDTQLPADHGQHLRQALVSLEQALETAQRYDDQVTAINVAISSGKPISSLLALQNKIQQLPQLKNVDAMRESVPALQQKLKEKLHTVVDGECQRYENLTNLTQYDLFANELKKIRNSLQNLGDTQLVARAEQALERLKEQKQRLEQERKETEIRERITALDTKASLKKLYESRSYLQRLAGLSDKTEPFRQAKLGIIEKEIEEQEQAVERLQDRFEEVTSEKRAEDLKTDLLRMEDRYSGTDYQVQLHGIQTQVEVVRHFFRRLAEAERERWQTPEEAQQVRERIAGLGQMPTALPVRQQAAIQKAQERLDSQIAQKKQEAEGWLKEVEGEVAGTGATPQLKQKVNSPPAFLPASSLDQLHQLQKQIADQLEKQNQLAQDEARWRQEIQSFGKTDRLAALYEGQESLKQITNLPPTVAKTRDDQLIALQREISRLEKQAEEMCRQLEQLNSSQNIGQWRDDLMKRLYQYQDTPYASRLEEAKAKGQQISQLLHQLEAINPHGHLAHLNQAQKQLQEMPILSLAIDSLQKKLSQQVEQNIKNRTEEVNKLCGEVEQLLNSQEVEKWRERSMRLANQYRGTKYEATLDAAQNRAEKLRSFFKGMEEIEKQKLSQPDDVQQQTNGLNQLEREFAASLSELQQQKVVQIRQKTAVQVHELEQKAISWLKDQQSNYHLNGNWQTVEKQLQTPPVFLPASYQAELQTLQKTVSQKIAEDKITHIESAFYQLSRHQRQECLQRLTKIFNEG